MHTLPDDGFGTLAIHAGQEPEPRSGAIMTPIYQTSTFVQDGVARPRNGFEYARMTNPTRTALQENLAALEPTTLACMHGSAFRGDGGALLRELAGVLDGLFNLGLTLVSVERIEAGEEGQGE